MIKVFLVEDEIVIREGIREMVPWNEYGFQLCGEAADGEMALPMIREQKPDVLITDIRMPFMDGLELCRLVRRELPEIKIVIISGYDDFEYARKAISIGVERYLLKPLSKHEITEVLAEIRTRYEEENAQKTYYEKFEAEIQQYEKNSRRDFFEQLVSGKTGLNSLFEQAEKLNIDISARQYNIILFTMSEKEETGEMKDGYSQETAELQQAMEQFFQNNDRFLLFRSQMFTYAVLVKGDREDIALRTRECTDYLQREFTRHSPNTGWFIAVGKSVERLGMLSECYLSASRAFLYRYTQQCHYMEYQEEDLDIRDVDAENMNPQIIQNFLSSGLLEEAEGFVDNYFKSIGESALQSKMFRQYIWMNVHFGVSSFLKRLGYEKEELESRGILEHSFSENSPEDIREQVARMLQHGIRLREDCVKKRYRNVLDSALAYIRENYTDSGLTLNKAACAANVSANHFSALFSQEMNQTFIEYLTELRMNKAKELLRCTDMRSGEIALEAGYKDAHYFSFLFKKTQGCTPSDYRNQNRRLES